jgi:multiple sugar transport system substrate-binding protein
VFAVATFIPKKEKEGMAKTKGVTSPGLAMLVGCCLCLAATCRKPQTEDHPPGGKSEGSRAPAGKQRLTIWWAQWTPASGLQELADEFGAAQNVDIKVHQIPWANFQDQVFQEFGKPETAFDIVVGDSQWLGRGATRGLYLDLTAWLPTAVDLKALHPLALKYLAEYPTGSGHHYAAPAETDAMGWAYRKDWFNDPSEKAAFKQRYHKELAVPETWDDLRAIAEFFTRAGDKRYGAVLITGRGYDDVVMGFEQVLYAFGGSWGDPKTLKVKGALDSGDSVKALDFFKGLLKYAPPGGSKLSYGEALEPFVNGSSAMLMNYFAFFPDLAKKMGDKVGFFAMPRNGDRRCASLGGQGFSISTKVAPAQQALAKRFIAWFLRTDVQQQWIRKPGGFTANAEILKSDAFKSASPYNAAFSQSLDIVQDFWNVPVYNELIAATVQQIGEALDGKKSSQDALSQLAAEHEKILSQATP